MTISRRSANVACAFLVLSSFGIAQEKESREVRKTSQPVDLGTLGGSTSQANAVSLNGAISGMAELSGDAARHAFLKAAGSTTLQDLGTLSGGTSSVGTGVNVRNQVSGYSEYNDPTNGIVTHGFFYQNGVLTDVGTLGGPSSYAYGINDFGFEAGYSLLSDGATTHGFLYDPFNGTLYDLGALTSTGNSAAYAINDLGIAAGSADTAKVDASGFAVTDAVIFNPYNKKVTDLGNLGASPAQATALNNYSAVVGFSSVPNGNTDAFYWNSGKFTDLGTLGGSYSQATGINDRGTVVGFSNITGNADVHAFVWTSRMGLVDLNSLLPANSGWVLNAAYAINRSGEIVGVGVHNGASHGFSLTLRSDD